MKISINPKRLAFVVLLLFVATIEIGGCGGRGPGKPPLPTPEPIPPKPQCECSLMDLVCVVGQSTCLEFDCVQTLEYDGKCFLYSGPDVDEPLGPLASTLFGVSFTAYQDAIRSGQGTPDVKVWEMISKKAPNPDIAHAVKYMTNDFLYIALARDVKPLTMEGPAGGMEITAISDKKATLGLIEAIKAGAILALKNGDASAITAPIGEFFQKNPDFKPVNPGLCYADNNFGSPAECIGTLLEMRMELLIKK